MRPYFHDVHVKAFLPSEKSLLRMKKSDLVDWLYLACRNWETESDLHLEYAKRMTERLAGAQSFSIADGRADG